MACFIIYWKLLSVRCQRLKSGYQASICTTRYYAASTKHSLQNYRSETRNILEESHYWNNIFGTIFST